VESDRRRITTPRVVIISTSFLRSFFRRPFARWGLQEKKKAMQQQAIIHFIID
jgi:hypothetical protein